MSSIFSGFRRAAQRVRGAVPRRPMGADHGHGGPGGIHFHVSPWHEHTGTALATLMWLWVFYRVKEDGAVVLGLVHPWDAHGDHGHEPHFVKEHVGAVPKVGEAEEHHDEEEVEHED